MLALKNKIQTVSYVLLKNMGMNMNYLVLKSDQKSLRVIRVLSWSGRARIKGWKKSDVTALCYKKVKEQLGPAARAMPISCELSPVDDVQGETFFFFSRAERTPYCVRGREEGTPKIIHLTFFWPRW